MLHNCDHTHRCCQHNAFLGLGDQAELKHSTCWGVWGAPSFLCWGAEGGLTGLTPVLGPHLCPSRSFVQPDSPCPLGCLASLHMQSPDSAKPLQIRGNVGAYVYLAESTLSTSSACADDADNADMANAHPRLTNKGCMTCPGICRGHWITHSNHSLDMRLCPRVGYVQS